MIDFEMHKEQDYLDVVVGASNHLALLTNSSELRIISLYSLADDLVLQLNAKYHSYKAEYTQIIRVSELI